MLRRVATAAVLAAALLATYASPAPAHRGDRDHDRLSDRWERKHGLSVGQKSTWGDPDGDGLKNRSELVRRFDPLEADSDLDGLPDRAEVRQSRRHTRRSDRDRDRLPDRWERRHGLSVKSRSHRGDADDDGLSNRWEYIWAFNPQSSDSDRDGRADAHEVELARATASAKKQRTIRLISAPEIVGVLQEGHLLAASAGKWAGATPIAYDFQWQRCAANGTGCGAIPGATHAAHQLTNADVGHAMRVLVTARNQDGRGTAQSHATAPVVGLPASGGAPAPAGPAHDDPPPPQPEQSEPAPTEPIPSDPEPIQPAPSDPEPTPSDPAPAPSDPAPTPDDPAPTQPPPADPEPIDSQPSGLFVDAAGLGGSCSDARTVEQASSVSTPWCTLGRALSAASSGSQIWVRRGAYPSQDVSSLTRTAYVTVRAYPGEERQVAVAGLQTTNSSFLRFRDLQFTGRVTFDRGSANLQVIGSGLEQGSLVQDGVSDVLFEDNDIASPTWDGVFLSSSYAEPAIADVVIRGNRFDSVGRVAINARNFVNLTIEGNDIANVTRWDGIVHSDGIRTYNGGTGLIIRNNVIRNMNAQGIFIKDGKVFDVTIENNVIYGVYGGYYAMNIYDVDGLRIVNNTVWNNSGGAVFQGTATNVVLVNNVLQSLIQAAGASVSGVTKGYNYVAGGYGFASAATEISSGIGFVNPAAGDYRLAAGSAGIDAGTSSGALPTDLLGKARVDTPGVQNVGGGSLSYYDMGAYEFQP